MSVLVPAHPGSPGQRAVNGNVCVCVVGGYGGPEGWPAMPPGYPPPPGYEYYSSYYYPPYGAYPPGYDYSHYYDYSAYYSQPPPDWSSYAAAAAPSYATPYTGVLALILIASLYISVGYCMYDINCAVCTWQRIFVDLHTVIK